MSRPVATAVGTAFLLFIEMNDEYEISVTWDAVGTQTHSLLEKDYTGTWRFWATQHE